MIRVCTPDNLSSGWQHLATPSGLTVSWLRTLEDLKVKISGRFTSTLANSAVLTTLPPEAVAGIPISHIQVSRYTSLINSSATTRLMILETDGRIRNTTGLSFAAGQYLFADHSAIYQK